jgi:Flp pilus assembly protein TadG
MPRRVRNPTSNKTLLGAELWTVLRKVLSVALGNGVRYRRSAGQAITEFALVLPLILCLVGAGTDFARAYQQLIKLQTATRDAAEYIATNDKTAGAAATDAKAVVCAEFGQASNCSDPSVTVTSFSLSTIATGATVTHPIATVTITASTSFRTLFPYPYLTNTGAMTLSKVSTYSVIQGR